MAMSVFDEMRDIGMRPTVDTYAYLISCADKCKKFDECLEIFRMCREDSSVKLNTEIYNNVMWVAEMADNASLVLELLREMETNSIQRDHQTYSAATNACERNGDGETALHVLDLMTSEGIVLTPGVGQAVVWSCVKSGMWKEALEIFDIMGEVGVKREAFCYSGAIWACEQSGDWERAVELLRRMKVDKNFKRDTISFDGAISALCKAGKWEKARELMTWMDRDQVPKSDVTYRNVLGVLYDAEQMEVLEEIYLLALREELYCPWVTGSKDIELISNDLCRY
jgi:pentatricopeptide repeat protein